MVGRYAYTAQEIERGEGVGSHLLVTLYVSQPSGLVKIGEYVRNYHNMFHTFCPFEQDRKEYALFSRDYGRTSVMSLPDCTEIAIDQDSKGFCPVDFYVPVKDEDYNDEDSDINGSFGFVAGCYWGDDRSWKIRFIDLSMISEGKVSVDGRLGYIQMPRKADSLGDLIDTTWWDRDDQIVEITCVKSFSTKVKRGR